MKWRPEETEWLIRVLFGIGGIVATVFGSWVASKIHVYQENRSAHLDELKTGVLTPLCEILKGEFSRVVAHQSGVIVEELQQLRLREGARVVEQDDEIGPGLKCFNPWPNGPRLMTSVLYEDARENHFPELIAEAERFATAWTAFAEHCKGWVEDIADEILRRSQISAWLQPAPAPYVMQYRLAVFVYRRLFHLETNALSTMSQGQYSTLEGAPVLRDMTGSAAFASEEQLGYLTAELDKIIAERREPAKRLAATSKKLLDELQELHRMFEHGIAGKKLRRQCDLVTFF
jgi:hypothetical protein